MEMQHQNWIEQARAHWKEHLPKMFARLTKAGTLETALTEAAQATSQGMRALTTQGATQTEAWEQVREQYLFLPEEPAPEEKQPQSQGYRAHRELMQGLGSLGMSED